MKSFTLSLAGLLILAAGVWYSGFAGGLLWSESAYVVEGGSAANTVQSGEAASGSPPVVASVKITPQTLNLRSKGRPLKAHINLPSDFEPDDVDPATVEFCLPDGRCSTAVSGQVAGKKFVATIDRPEIIKLLAGPRQTTGRVKLTVKGIVSGRDFDGTDVITVRAPK